VTVVILSCVRVFDVMQFAPAHNSLADFHTCGFVLCHLSGCVPMASSAADDCLREIITLARKLQPMSGICVDFKLIEGERSIYRCQISPSEISNSLTNIAISLLRLNQ